ncbi:hypothetical protein P691DRAFT_805939 [Macrolepiota fuliginosa MF-IS2]|uniref:Uncharacterized protein n=1 Tax=Macrolepiota fuliginosa MF-IS2 TaxID=1400762 RepID=A0A9P5X9J5_9AGAR|nr:hypothetical protein P691DRAFT_805939 [Macrolepiota fuliginosa MF-IS2]
MALLCSQMRHPPAGAGSTATAETYLFSRWITCPSQPKLLSTACYAGKPSGFRPICFGKLCIPSPCITPAI